MAGCLSDFTYNKQVVFLYYPQCVNILKHKHIGNYKKDTWCLFDFKIFYMKTRYLIILTLATGILFAGCEYTPYVAEEAPEVTEEVSFVNDVEPIFTEAGCNAASCHGGTISPNLSTGSAYNSLMSDPKYTNLGHDDNIYFVAAPENNHSKNYTAEQAAIVKKWLEQGAPDN